MTVGNLRFSVRAVAAPSRSDKPLSPRRRRRRRRGPRRPKARRRRRRLRVVVRVRSAGSRPQQRSHRALGNGALGVLAQWPRWGLCRDAIRVIIRAVEQLPFKLRASVARPFKLRASVAYASGRDSREPRSLNADSDDAGDCELSWSA